MEEVRGAIVFLVMLLNLMITKLSVSSVTLSERKKIPLTATWKIKNNTANN